MKIPRARSSLITLLALPVLMTQVARADYQSTVLANGPKAYYRFNDDSTRTITNKNLGTLGAAGNATNDLLSYKQAGVYGTDPTGIVKSFPGALAGDRNRSSFFDYTTRTIIPFTPAINPPNTQPFTLEAWFYPATDQNNVGMAPINNRYVVGANRQGWTYFQRKVNADSTGGDPVGWNFRMFNGVGGNSPLDTTAVVPFEVGKWLHIVTVYDPTSTTEATVMIFINGVLGASNHVSGQPLYQPCTGDHDLSESPAGQPGLAIGNYNNCNVALNPYFGGVDEFAWYSNALSPAQILSHYQNGTNANRATPYDVLVKSHNPVVYLRLDEVAPGPDTALNLGDLRSRGHGTNSAEVRHPGRGAVVSDPKSGAAAYHTRNGSATTLVPYSVENNPDAGTPFTFETWIRPMRDQQGGQAPFGNRYQNSGDRTGWVIFQRFPNTSYASVPGINNEGHGWNFRMYSGAGTSGGSQDLTTAADYAVGQWQHLVFTWEPVTDNGLVGALGMHHQFNGILTAYVNGVPVKTNTPNYAANINPTDNGTPPADLAVGSYNSVSSPALGNAFEGDVGEFAIYNNIVLTPDQVLAHYQAGTNSNPGTNYETLVMTAGFVAPQAQQTSLPKTYLRFNDPAYYPAANSGTVGLAADGNLVLTTNIAAGPQSPAFAGFEASNAALPLDGLKQWASFNNPSGLNISGQITLEAWVKPGATQGDPARIITHGPPTTSDYIFTTPGDGHVPPDGSVTNSPEVFLRIEGGANYVVGSKVTIYTNNLEIGTNSYTASFPIPGGDLGGNWVHLAGTYDGSKWRLYRNGLEVASSTAAVGALPVTTGDWAIGSTGNGWANNFAGPIDEAAIYDKALTPAQVASHYVTGKAGTAALTITRSGAANVTITWPTGTTLQQSSLVTGTYTNTPGSPVSPLTIPAIGTKFYRWTLP